ncbi:hypothetical protein PAGU2638_08020 [Lysobacter sp. PAGU 2638]
MAAIVAFTDLSIDTDALPLITVKLPGYEAVTRFGAMEPVRCYQATHQPDHAVVQALHTEAANAERRKRVIHDRRNSFGRMAAIASLRHKHQSEFTQLPAAT